MSLLTIDEARARMAPWLEALADPARAQHAVLERLLARYSNTGYGRERGAREVGSYEDYVRAFPVRTYAEYKPLLERVLAGEVELLLDEPPVAVQLTKGTSGEPKLFPLPPSRVHDIPRWYRRAVDAVSVLTGTTGWMSGQRLNLLSSGRVGRHHFPTGEVDVGFSIAIHFRYMTLTDGASFEGVPSTMEMDGLPGKPTRENWHRRYEFAFQRARNEDITYLGGVPNVLVGFGKYLLETHGVRPRDVWNIHFVLSGGAPSTFSRYSATLRDLYGRDASIRELYIGTEGEYGAQLDEKRAWSPMYDILLLEVQTIDGVKPLHEMHPGEIGSLIVSTPLLARYRVGDLILAFEPPYFQCIGREGSQLAPYRFGRLSGRGALKLRPKKLPRFRR